MATPTTARQTPRMASNSTRVRPGRAREPQATEADRFMRGSTRGRGHGKSGGSSRGARGVYSIFPIGKVWDQPQSKRRLFTVCAWRRASQSSRLWAQRRGAGGARYPAKSALQRVFAAVSGSLRAAQPSRLRFAAAILTVHGKRPPLRISADRYRADSASGSAGRNSTPPAVKAIRPSPLRELGVSNCP